jgi:hypothetical protein
MHQFFMSVFHCEGCDIMVLSKSIQFVLNKGKGDLVVLTDIVNNVGR